MQFAQVKEGVYESGVENGMRVPVRVYASAKMLEKMQGDRTLMQASNVARLPGIIGAAMVMPDGHEGYGFPIGGVAAFSLKGGIVSPGGIGYDINCTDGETNVLLEHGAYLKMNEIEESFTHHSVPFTDLKNFSTSKADILCVLKRPENSCIYEITTKTGRLLRVTGDHPVYTKNGMIAASKLTGKDSLAIRSFTGVHFEKPSDEGIVDEKTIERILAGEKESLGGNAVKQVMGHIKKRMALPLKHSSPQLPFLTKILGFVLGDGSISFLKKRKGVVWFYGKEADLESIRADVQRLGFTPSRVYTRLRKHEISTHYKKYSFVHLECSFRVSSTAFASLLVALGAPSGLKTAKSYAVPAWLFKSPLWIKRLFLASLFGADMSAPATLNKYNFYAPTLGMNKLETLQANGVEFLTQIKALLGEFEIETSPIMKVEGYRLNGKRGVSCGYRVQVLSKPENLLRFFENVSFEYCLEKFRGACLAVNYLRLKERVKDQRANVRKTAIALYSDGKTPAEVCKTLSSPHATAQFIRHSLWTEFSDSPRIAFNFMSFSEYREKYALGPSGLAWDEIQEIRAMPFHDLVYDLTINDENHNFFANGFVVSNCGVRLLRTDLTVKDVQPKLKPLINELYNAIPCGVGSKGRIRLTERELGEAVTDGVQWAIREGYGVQKDAEHCEENGHFEGGDYSTVSPMAKKRGMPQFGTLGSGNHFCEVQKVDKIFDAQTAQAFGITGEGQVTVMIHSGSRGYGHQVCDDNIRIMLEAAKKYGISLPDPELNCAPLESPEAQNYLGQMRTAINFAFNNRHLMAAWARESFAKVFGQSWETMGMDLVYDVCHNIGKYEEHEVGGKNETVFVHRKGATRAFWKGRPEIPQAYRSVGQPVIIPGSMNTASYLLCGLEGAKQSWGSSCHGAGRTMSRHEAVRRFDGGQLIRDMEAKGQAVRVPSLQSLAEEAGGAYKDVDQVVAAVATAGISKLVARMVPLGVVKG
ncbi:MAG: RtcB family protein [Candidatus Micrarchaeota archaeon]